METFLGLLAVAAFVVAVIALSAAVTFVVVKLTPSRREKDKQPAQ